jgi:NAD(P)H-hydrate epimerase
MEILITKKILQSILQPRKKEAHKGDFGHALLVAGSEGMMGSAVLASKACLRSGVGLLTTHVPICGVKILQIAIPEAIVSKDAQANCISGIKNSEKYTSVAIGPGISTNETTQNAFYDLLKKYKSRLIIDADALNCLSLNSEWLKLIPANSILTPHPKEFERLVGKWNSDEDKIKKLKQLCNEHSIYVLLKSSKTILCSPNGDLFINTTGNPGLAKGGSGDVLTGMLLAFFSQGYSTKEAALLAIFLHGLAADLAVVEKTEYGLLASDLIEFIPKAFKVIQ